MTDVKWILGSAVLGALTMFLFDPAKGNRRRAMAKDKMYSAVVKTRKQIDATSRDLANRAKGLRHEASNLFSKPEEQKEEQKAA